MLMMVFNSYNYWGDPKLRHAPWYGLQFADYELPGFMFTMGVSLALSFHNRRDNHKFRRGLRIAKRFLKLIILQLMFNLYPNWRLDVVRIPGVLFRLSCVYMVVSMMLIFIPYKQVPKGSRFRDVIPLTYHWVVVGAFTVLYLCIVYGFPVPGCPTGYIGPGGLKKDPENMFCTGGSTVYIDKLVFGVKHIQNRPPCSEHVDFQCKVPVEDLGIVGILTAVLTCFIGVQAGYTYLKYMPNKKEKTSDSEYYMYNSRTEAFFCSKSHLTVVFRWMIGSCICFILTSILLGGNSWTSPEGKGFIPMIKTLWTPPFALGLSSIFLAILSVLYLVIDVGFTIRGRKFIYWSGFPFYSVGRNSIAVYMGHRYCHTWIPFIHPSLYGLYRFTLSQLFWTSHAGALCFALVAYYFDSLGLYWTV